MSLRGKHGDALPTRRADVGALLQSGKKHEPDHDKKYALAWILKNSDCIPHRANRTDQENGLNQCVTLPLNVNECPSGV